jgi:hypothetical protein
LRGRTGGTALNVVLGPVLHWLWEDLCGGRSPSWVRMGGRVLRRVATSSGTLGVRCGAVDGSKTFMSRCSGRTERRGVRSGSGSVGGSGRCGDL